MTYHHEPTPWRSPLDGGHPILDPLRDAIDHVKQAAASGAGVNKAVLRGEIATLKHHMAFLEARAHE